MARNPTAILALALVSFGCRGRAPAAPQNATDSMESDCGPPVERAWLAATATAPFEGIAVQLDRVPTFGIVLYPVIPSVGFSRVPVFTLYRDGTLVRRTVDPNGKVAVLRSDVGRAQALDLAARLRALGFERLKSHVDECSCPIGSGDRMTRICTSDANYTIVRALGSDGTLRHVFVYAGYWNDESAASSVLEAITSYAPEGARPYVAESATLVIHRWERDPDDGGCPPVDPAMERLLVPADRVTIVRGAELRRLEAAVGSNAGGAILCSPTMKYAFSIFPWLPGADHARAIDVWKREELAAARGAP